MKEESPDTRKEKSDESSKLEDDLKNLSQQTNKDLLEDIKNTSVPKPLLFEDKKETFI